jgi:hypothetical protein
MATSVSLRIRLLSVAMAVAFAIPAMRLCAQSTATDKVQNDHGDLVREIHPKPTPTPFPLDAHTRTISTLEFLAPDQMTAADQSLVVANEAEIARRAALQGFNLERASGWGYEQAVCPVFPDHLILEYSRNDGAKDVSLFSVAIPRGTGSGGHVRVIPVRRRSYSLWTPASSNELTLNDFNHMVAEGGKGVSPDWLTLSLCYAALAGGHVRAALVPASHEEEAYPLFVPAKLSVGDKGGAQIHLVDTTRYPDSKAKAMNWVLTFAQNGRLLKVAHTVADEEIERPLKPTPAEKAVPVKGAAIDLSKSGN